MAATSDIIALAKAKLAEISKLQGELDELRHILNGGDGVSHHVNNDEPVSGARKKRTVSHRRPKRHVKRRKRAKLPNSSSSRSEGIIRGVGHPLHVDDLIEKIQAKFSEKVAKQTLVSSLSRLAKAGDRFVRTAPNTFGLIGMEGNAK